jgi:hypothetical protein
MKPLGTDDPRTIGGYRLRGRLGTGGMGRVYLGLSPGGRAVAIKVVHPGLARDAEFLRRFSQEVAAARAVSGIYTAPVVASGLAEHPPWLATAFVPGPSLDQVVSEHGPIPGPALWSLLAGLVEALQAIHACGVVHRDLKPANVLLAIDGPRVIDFGISRAADGTTLTAAGTVFGTPGYMSPEQAEGKAAGPASDVFALGCVLVYAATGAGPFGSGTAAAVLYRVVHGDPALTGMPPRLRDTVAACLAKDPGARPTLAALASTIGEATHATGPSALAFWPRPVAGLIAAYQARLEEETRPGADARAAGAGAGAGAAGAGAVAGAGAGAARAGAAGLSSGAAGHPQTAPAEPGSRPQRLAGPQHWGAGSSGPGTGQAQPVSPGYPHPQGYASTQVPHGAWPSQASQQSRAPQPGPASPGLPSVPRGYLPDGGGPAYGWPSGGPASGGSAGGRPGAGGWPAKGGSGGGGPVGYPAPYQPGSRGPIMPMPATMVRAVRLMYAGAAYALIYAIGFVAVVGGIIKNHPYGMLARAGLASIAAPVILLSLVEIALWLWVARGCRNRRNGARMTGTVLFGIHTLGALVLVSTHSSLGLTNVLTLLSWLIACGAAVSLWRPASSAFFAAHDSASQVGLHR